jgi:single-stranded-DNA-specific exonuclease
VPVVRVKRWSVSSPDTAKVKSLCDEFGVSELIGKLLCNRGITEIEDADRFLNPAISSLHDPFLMTDMRPAVERILRAIAQKERILIYGDYDVDGTTATVILKKALELIGANVDYYIPLRLKDGYGMHEEAIERARDNGYSLVISVDTGIRAHRVVEVATAIGVDVIITDHHLPEEGLPKAVAILNPKRPDCGYPEKSLAGVGVAFKLVQALLQSVDFPNRERVIQSFLKIVAIGTIADIVPLVGENRIIARFGLDGLLSPNNRGLGALMDVVGLKDRKKILSSDIGFRIGPRINAVGRMAGASAAVDLFSAATDMEAMQIAEQLNNQNFERQQVEASIIDQILQLLELEPHHAEGRVAVLAGEGWHRGVIGIAASKVVDRINRPTLIISIENGIGHGSGRSIKGFHLLDGLTACDELFDKYGGHSHAAGVTIKADRIDELRRRLNEYAGTMLTDEDLIPVVEIDAMLSVNAVTLELIRELERLEPFGEGNPEPVFATNKAMVAGDPRVLKEKHLKLRLIDGGRPVDCLWWGGGLASENIFAGDEIKVAYTVSENIFNGRANPQMTVVDLKY